METWGKGEENRFGSPQGSWGLEKPWDESKGERVPFHLMELYPSAPLLGILQPEPNQEDRGTGGVRGAGVGGWPDVGALCTGA